MDTIDELTLPQKDQKFTRPKGKWYNTSYGEPVLSRFYNSPLMTTRLGVGKGAAGAVTRCHSFNEDDQFVNLNGNVVFSNIGPETTEVLPKGNWLDSAANTIWTRAEDLIHTENSMMDFPCVPDINGALRQINDEQLIYINSYLSPSEPTPRSCFALSSEEMSNADSRIAGIAHENDNTLIIAKRNNYDVDPPEGDWFKYAEETFYTFKFFGQNMIVARLETDEGFKTAIACYNDDDRLTNEHGYFKFETIGQTTNTVLPEGNWRDTAYNVVWAQSDQFCNPGRIRTVSGDWADYDEENLIYLSCFLDHGSMNTRNIFTHSSDLLRNNYSRFEL